MAMSDETWRELSESLPKIDDAHLLKYLAGREALIDEEAKQRSDHSFRQNLSPIACQADRIVAKIRKEEQRTIWTPQLEEKLAAESVAAGNAVTIHPGMMFNMAKGIMEKTELWKIVRRMPKGALLHAHLDAIVSFDYILECLLKEPGMHMAYVDEKIDLTTAEGRDFEEMYLNFRFFKEEKNAELSIWHTRLGPGHYVNVAKAADTFPQGGRQGFCAWMKAKMTISELDAQEQHHGVDHIWRKFTRCFMVTGSIIHYEPIFRAFWQHLFSQWHEDGVQWGEIRFTWPLNYYRLQAETPEQDYSHMFTVINEELARFRAHKPSFWGIRMIWTSIRFLDTRGIIESMDHAITTKIEFPSLLAGYDLVAQEDGSRTLKDLLPELFWFRQQCAEEGVNLPFFFHAGECLGSGDDTDKNLYDAVLLGTRRIGHGFSLYKHPLLIDMVKDKRILIESCPISNEVLRLCGSVLSHPLPALLARGVPCALSNDDPAMLGQGTAGLTHDTWSAIQCWENLGLAGLGSMAENSVRWACFEDQTSEEWARDIKEASLGSGIKAKRLQEWRVEWEKFCLWVVEHYGEQYGDEE